MAAAVICERCGKIIPANNALHLRVHPLTSAENYSTKTLDYFDVCKDCYKDVEAILTHKEKNK